MKQNPKNLPIAEDWFEIDPPDEFGIRRIRETHTKGGSIWLVEGEDKCLLVEF
ncbi:MAG: hypothetical protein AAF429_11540 [Pseudomonadota bacterium]